MRTRLWSAWTVVTLAAVAGTGPVAAVSPLVVMDANDQVLGEVLDYTHRGPARMLYRAGSAKAWVTARSSGLDSSVPLVYADALCAADPHVWVTPDAMMPIGIFIAGQMYVVDTSVPGTEFHSLGLRYPQEDGSLGTCEPNDQTMPANPLPAPVGPLNFTLPLRLELNPVVFQDDFALGAFTRWSSSTNP